MRWSYKTVHYELKKEGLLGSTFLDESEVELSLNEYGKAGWELVSLLETLDGLVAVFKQPLSIDSGLPVQESLEEQVVPEPAEKEEIILSPLSTDEKSTYDEMVVVEDFDVVTDDEPKSEKSKKSSPAEVDVGSIVIE